MATSKIVELDDTNTCKICDNALARYSCPKCNILYCSLSCYQAKVHLECSESFYKDHICDELNLCKNTYDSKIKMLEILQKTHENNRISLSEDEMSLEEFDFDLNNIDQLDSDDNESILDIAERLAHVDLDDAEQVWDKLTEDEKQEFVAFLKSEDVTKLIPPWEPWWLYHDNNIQNTEGEHDYKIACPSFCEIKEFSQITSKEPADCVKYNLINIILAYVFTARYFNGEHFDFAQEAVSCIVSLSLTLKAALNFEDFQTSLKSIEQEITNSNWIVSSEENIQIMKEDLDRILKGPNKTEKKFYVLCALSDLHHLLGKAIQPTQDNTGTFTKKFPNDHFPKVELESPVEINNCIKKTEYYLSYSKYKLLL